jgi:hypothetical protein
MRGEVELLTQLLCRLLHTVVADSHGRDHVPCLLAHFLLGDHRHHHWWYRAAQGVKRHHLLLLIGVTVLDDAPESMHLQLYLHQERPIRVIGLCEDRVATPAAYLMNRPLDHYSIFEGVVADPLP